MSGLVSQAERRQRTIAPLRHGLYAEASDAFRLRRRKARNLVRRLRDTLPGPWDWYLGELALQWAEAEILAAGVWANLVEHGSVTPSGEPRRLLGEWRLLKDQQLRIRDAIRDHQERLRQDEQFGKLP
jgi:hypothetical protein